jgi:hypothetical protein
MTFEVAYCIAFFVLLLAMWVSFITKIRRSGGRIMPDKQAVRREGFS